MYVDTESLIWSYLAYIFYNLGWLNLFYSFNRFYEVFLQDADLSSFSNWLSKIYIFLLIITPIKEELLINKIDQLKSEFSANSIYENVITKADPLNVYNNADTFGKIQPETIFVRMIFRVISLIAAKSWVAIKNEQKSFIIEQFSVFLLHCICLFQSGEYFCSMQTTFVNIKGF